MAAVPGMFSGLGSALGKGASTAGSAAAQGLGQGLGQAIPSLIMGGGSQQPQVAPAMSALQARPLGNIAPPITSQSVAPVGNIVSGSGGASSINNPQIQALLSRLLQAGGTA